MKIGILADIHGNTVALLTVLRFLKREKVDRVLCAGDIIGYYPYFNEAIELVRENRIETIKGNHEAYVLGEIIVENLDLRERYLLDYTQKVITRENHNFLSELRDELRFNVSDVSILMVHGSPFNDKLTEYIYPDFARFDKFQMIDADVIIMGHTHYPFIKKNGDKLLINPGSCGQPRDYDPRASCVVWDVDRHEISIERLTYDVGKVIKDLEDFGISREERDILKRRK
jgi:putative phosphoesterase